MKFKIQTLALCTTTAFVLTACGGSGSGSDQYVPTPNDPNPVSNLDYSKANNTDLVILPVFELSQTLDHFILDISNIAEEIHYSMMSPKATNSFKCSSGTATKNSNGSVTLNNCNNIKFGNSVFDETEGLTFTGTIYSKISDTTNSEKYDITLSNLIVKDDDGEINTFNGNIVHLYTDLQNGTSGQYDINKLELSWTDGKDKEKYVLSDYRLNETYLNSNSNTPATSKGKLQGEVEGKKFAVNFDTRLNYDYKYDSRDGYDYNFEDVSINIYDANDSKNSIKISNTTNGKASIQTTANGKTLSPRIVEWDYLD